MTKYKHNFELYNVYHDKSGEPWPDARRPVERLVVPRDFFSGQTIEYYCAMAIERGVGQVCQIRSHLKEKHGLDFSSRQISGAIQRLKNDGVVYYYGNWKPSA